MRELVEPTLCRVCGKEDARGVVTSIFGPGIFAVGLKCLARGAEPYRFVVGGLIGLTRAIGVPSERVSVVAASLSVVGKTEDELWSEVERVNAELRDRDQTNAMFFERNPPTEVERESVTYRVNRLSLEIREGSGAVHFDVMLTYPPSPAEIIRAANDLAVRLVEELRALGGMRDDSETVH